MVNSMFTVQREGKRKKEKEGKERRIDGKREQIQVDR
jgi:hypothetical protein